MHSSDSIIAALENAPALIVPMLREVPPANLKHRHAPQVWSVPDHAYSIEELLLNPDWAWDHIKLAMLGILIPAYNEAVSITGTIQQLRDVMDRTDTVYEIIVIDDGSKDDTAALAEQTGVRV